jgi:hypothetical protein
MNNDETELADTSMQDVQDLFIQPTAEEVSRLTYGELRDLRGFIPEEARNDFAHLLNRGSPLE